jgi:hypothetical protein
MRFLNKAATAASIAGISAACLIGGSAAVAVADTAPFVHLHPTVVSAGDRVNVTAGCGDSGEGLNWVGSHAFAPTGNDGPWEGNGGVARITKVVNGTYYGYATIANVQPGSYWVGERCGGGNAGGVYISVVNTK